jgi:hypothetical protein
VLAPVLARLEAIPGVASARTDSSGRFFWITPAPGARPPEVAERCRAALGASAALLGPAAAAAQLAAHERGDPWLGAGEVMTLSFVEGRLLSVRIAGDAAAESGASAAQREAVAEAVRVELFAALERVHAEGGRKSSGWIDEEWPAIAAAAAARCAPDLPPEVRGRLSAALPDLLRGRRARAARPQGQGGSTPSVEKKVE